MKASHVDLIDTIFEHLALFLIGDIPGYSARFAPGDIVMLHFLDGCELELERLYAVRVRLYCVFHDLKSFIKLRFTIL